MDHRATGMTLFAVGQRPIRNDAPRRQLEESEDLDQIRPIWIAAGPPGRKNRYARCCDIDVENMFR